jgi:hypothetical protein
MIAIVLWRIDPHETRFAGTALTIHQRAECHTKNLLPIHATLSSSTNIRST